MTKKVFSRSMSSSTPVIKILKREKKVTTGEEFRAADKHGVPDSTANESDREKVYESVC